MSRVIVDLKDTQQYKTGFKDGWEMGRFQGKVEGARREQNALKRAWGGMSDEFDRWLDSRSKGKATR